VSDSSEDGGVVKIGQVLLWILGIIGGGILGLMAAGAQARQNARIGGFLDAVFGR
jgi:hypothetical protein